jgi:hypothetical protein
MRTVRNSSIARSSVRLNVIGYFDFFRAALPPEVGKPMAFRPGYL